MQAGAQSGDFARLKEADDPRDLSATLNAGVTLVHGDTGSGKSTLLRLLAGVLPARGRLTLADVRLDAEAAAYRRHVFFCDPATDAFDQRTARDTTALLSAGDTHFNEDRWQVLVEGFALAPHLDRPMVMLSTGSKRKVGLVAALASGRALELKACGEPPNSGRRTAPAKRPVSAPPGQAVCHRAVNFRIAWITAALLPHHQK